MPTPESQASYVADRLLQLREEGLDLERAAVLYRNHSHSLELQVELTRRNIPFRVRSGLRFFEQRHVKDVVAHLRWIDNPRDEVAFSRVVKLRAGFGARLAARLWARLAGGDAVRALLALDPESADLPRTSRTSLADLRELIAELSSPRLLGMPGEAIRRVVDGFYRDWVRDALENAGSRLEDLGQLAVFADGFPDVNAFLAELALLNDLSGEDIVSGPEDECVTLSTTHQAKGLEWDAVFVLWLAEGRFPSARADDEEEERRLFYVACTRAKTHLELVHPEMARDRYRVDVILDPSRFLLELEDALTDNVVVAPEPQRDLPALEGGGRYTLPTFLDSVRGDDDVN